MSWPSPKRQAITEVKEFNYLLTSLKTALFIFSSYKKFDYSGFNLIYMIVPSQTKHNEEEPNYPHIQHCNL